MIDHAVVLAIGDLHHRSQLVYNRARAMLPALGKPLVVRVMDRLYRAAIRRFIVVVGEDEGEVASYLNTHWLPDVDIEYVFQFSNVNLLETLSRITTKTATPFILAGYNSFTHTQFYTSLLKQHETHENALILSGAEMTLSEPGGRSYYALLSGEQVTAITETPPDDAAGLHLTTLMACGQQFVDYLCGLNAEQISAGGEECMDIIRQYIQTPGASTVVAETGWTLQIETDDDLLKLGRQLLNDGQDAHILSELPPSTRIIPPVRIDPQVSVGQGAQIGPYVYLEQGSTVEHDAVVRNAMILNRGIVHAGQTVSDVIITSQGPIR